MAKSIDDVLDERGTKYGIFMNQARISQSIHIVLEQGMQWADKTRYSFAPDQLEAIHMIVTKLSRIHNGDPNHEDSWRDIAGYATLVADRLEKSLQEQEPKEQKLEVQDGEHKSTSQTEAGVSGEDR